MQLIYKNKQTELPRDESAFTMILEKVSELTKKQDVIFSHLIIDEIGIFGNHESFINERLNEIMQIEIVTRSTNEMIWDTMQSIHEYLQRAIPTLNKLIEESYDVFSKKTWEGIGQLSEGFQWLLQFITFTEAAPKQPSYWSEIMKDFKMCENNFKQLLEAVEVQDTVLILDILAYEIVPAYESLEQNIAKSLKDKEFFTHVN